MVNIAQLRNTFPKRLKSYRSATVPLEADWHWQIVVADNRNKMQIAPEITFEGSEPSPAAREVIFKEIERLETHNQRITACRVTVIAPRHKHRHGAGFQIHIWLTLPPHENIVVNHSPVDDARRRTGRCGKRQRRRKDLESRKQGLRLGHPHERGFDDCPAYVASDRRRCEEKVTIRTNKKMSFGGSHV
jgi:ribosome-associated translation inhibitor RaiA